MFIVNEEDSKRLRKAGVIAVGVAGVALYGWVKEVKGFIKGVTATVDAYADKGHVKEEDVIDGTYREKN